MDDPDDTAPELESDAEALPPVIDFDASPVPQLPHQSAVPPAGLPSEGMAPGSPAAATDGQAIPANPATPAPTSTGAATATPNPTRSGAATTTPRPNATSPPTPPIGSVADTPAAQPALCTRPPGGASVPRQRGKTKEAPQKDDGTAANKARKQDKLDAEDRAAKKEQARQDSLSQARAQIELDRQIMESRERESERRAVQRDSDWKYERDQAAERHKEERADAERVRKEEKDCADANQAAQDKSQQLFETAMLIVLASFAKGNDQPPPATS
ncbi:hypothetical protein PCASD_17542 [Puccinia coronata f. sp. avenae]|uniref:Uncharacterized protein n=1 Tax=Puccinia coronata f. sp. avenae TaxID=200324 RepID=A0A2N5U3U1_9BASI|nr:hypothetical protein PCASD_17542 [Puccinia coronata f. sp. avenae]